MGGTAQGTYALRGTYHRTVMEDRTMNRDECISAAIQDNRFTSRFWSKVDKSGACWVWTRNKTQGGYGQSSFRIGGRAFTLLSHRVSWVIANGPIPRGLFVLHNCPSGDNPACVNPDHLWLGTLADNNHDMMAKGRFRPHVGVRHPMARLTEADVRSIRERAKTTLHKVLASEYRLHVRTVSYIVTRKYWPHLD